MTARVRIGVVGCGRVATRLHLPALAGIADAQVVAVCDPDPVAAEEAARMSGGRSVELETLLDEVDVVAVCAPPAAHAGIAVAALERGRVVLLEKPVALEAAGAERIAAAAAGSGAPVVVGFNLRHHRLVREARAVIAGGALGAVRAVTTRLGGSQSVAAGAWREVRTRGGGALHELAPHHVDLWRFLSGDELVAVHAHTATVRSEDDVAVLSAHGARGLVASAFLTNASAEANELEVWGDAGRLTLSLYRFDGLELHRADAPVSSPLARARKLAGTAAALPRALRSARAGGEFLATYRREWEHVCAVARGAEPECTLADGLRALGVTLAALRSVESGQTEAVEPIGAAVEAER